MCVAMANATCTRKYSFEDIKYQGDAELALKSLIAISKWLNLAEYELHANFEETYFANTTKTHITKVTLSNSTNKKVEVSLATDLEWHSGKYMTVHYTDLSVITFYDELGVIDHTKYVQYNAPKNIYKKLCHS